MAEWTGLEPATPGVTGRYSNQLNYHSAWAAFEWMLVASTKCYKLGDPTGIRTPVPTVKGWCPRPLDDGDPGLTVLQFHYLTTCRSKLTGGAKRDRTADLLHAMQALSQLSYSPLIR